MAWRPAGFWRRCVAWSLDAALLALPLGLLLWQPIEALMASLQAVQQVLLDALFARMDDLGQLVGDPRRLVADLLQDATVQAAVGDAGARLGHALLVGTLGAVALAAPYWIGFEASRWQATPGKRAMGLRVTGPDGARASLGRVAGRFAAGGLSWLLLNLGHALALVGPDHRALHDLLAGTRVSLAPETPLRWPLWARAVLAVQFGALAWLLLWTTWRYLQALWILA